MIFPNRSVSGCPSSRTCGWRRRRSAADPYWLWKASRSATFDATDLKHGDSIMQKPISAGLMPVPFRSGSLLN